MRLDCKQASLVPAFLIWSKRCCIGVLQIAWHCVVGISWDISKRRCHLAGSTYCSKTYVYFSALMVTNDISPKDMASMISKDYRNCGPKDTFPLGITPSQMNLGPEIWVCFCMLFIQSSGFKSFNLHLEIQQWKVFTDCFPKCSWLHAVISLLESCQFLM